MRILPDFVSRTAMVVTRVIDESQFHQVIEQKIPDLIEIDGSLDYAKTIADNKSAFFLYLHDVEQDER